MLITPSTKYLTKFLHEAAIHEMAEDYKKQGYLVSKDTSLGNAQIDLIVSKGKEKIFFEFKAGNVQTDKTPQILQLKKLAQQEGAEFRIVYVKPPSNKVIQVEDIESTLYHYWLNDTPSEIMALSTHSSIIDVSSADIVSIRVDKGEIEVVGTCSILVGLQFGSNRDVDADIGVVDKESFLVSFSLTLDSNLQVKDVDYIEVDTSHWYGE